MNERASQPPAPPGGAWSASAYGGKPELLVFALKPLEQGGGLLLWPKVPDRAGRLWLEVPPNPDLEKELWNAYHLANEEAGKRAPKGAELKPRQADAVGLPKVEFGRECKVRADVNWGGRLHTDLPRTPLSPAASAAVWKLLEGTLLIADIPRRLPENFQLSALGFEREDKLEEWMVDNWDKTPFSEFLEVVGRQFRADRIGRIDILCRNKEKDRSGYTVIEIKRDRTSDDVVGQTQRYMGWVQTSDLVKGQDAVWGIIVCRIADQKVIMAVRPSPNLEIYIYDVRVSPDGERLVNFNKVPKER